MSDTGVVDPIRIPPWLRERVEHWWRDMPGLAQVFLALALLDVLLRAVGLVEPKMAFVGDPMILVGNVLPRDLWILLPALIVARRPDAATATPRILLSAVVLAFLELLTAPAFQLIGGASVGAVEVSAALSIVRTVVTIFGWVLLARGLAELNPPSPAPAVAGLSNIVALCVGGELLTSLFQLAVGPASDYGDAGLAMVVALSSFLGSFSLLGWGYLLWIVVRSLGDTRRPPEATVTAAVGACLAGVFGLALGIAGSFVMALQRPYDVLFGSSGQDVISVIASLTMMVGPSLILAAFALGLAEPPMPYVPPVPGALPTDSPFAAAVEREPEPAGDGISSG